MLALPVSDTARAMSRENVEFVEGLFAGADAMDKRALIEALPRFIAAAAEPDIEWVEDPKRMDGQVFRGHQGVRESFERWLEHFDEYGYTAEEFIDCDDSVLVIGRERARGLASGASVDVRHHAVWTIRAGKIARYQEFYDEQDARKAAGLSE
jgi:ketosteroid isomerase-like protein